MSWSLYAEVHRPFEVSALLLRAREVLAELLALDSLPELVTGAPMVTVETIGTDITFDVTLPGFDGIDVNTLDPGEHPDLGSMVVSLGPRYSNGYACADVVLCMAMGLAAADLGGGDYLESERAIVQPATTDPAQVITMTRLSPNDLGFAERCVRYMRQFKHLGDWPKS